MLTIAGQAIAASITAELQLDPDARLIKVEAVHRTPTPTGVKTKTYPGTFDDKQATFNNLPAGEGWFDLRLTFNLGSGATAIVEGWNAGVPESDYVEEQPLAPASVETIRTKILAMHGKAFADVVQVLDMQGNIQNAATK